MMMNVVYADRIAAHRGKKDRRESAHESNEYPHRDLHVGEAHDVCEDVLRGARYQEEYECQKVSSCRRMEELNGIEFLF